MRSVTDGDGQLVPRVAVTRMVVIPLVVALVVTVLVAIVTELNWRAVVFGLSVAGLALVITAFTLRASLGTGWSRGRPVGDQASVRRLRAAIRRNSVADLTDDERLVVGGYAAQLR